MNSLYGLLSFTNAPAVFQAMVNNVLRDMINKFVFGYLEGILIFSQNLTEHIQHVRAVLQRLPQNQLFVKVKKCELHSSRVSFPGFILSDNNIQTQSRWQWSGSGLAWRIGDSSSFPRVCQFLLKFHS